MEDYLSSNSAYCLAVGPGLFSLHLKSLRLSTLRVIGDNPKLLN